MEGCWRIVSTDAEGDVVYWSNGQGWVDRTDSDAFTDFEREYLDLPLDGAWLHEGGE